jgi:type I restriction enzyme S subunit
MGRVAIVPDGLDFIMLAPQVTYYRIGTKPGLSHLYLRFAFLGPDFQRQLNSDSDQSTRKYIGITDQKRLRIPLPPQSEQASIASYLTSIDNKIELNRKMNETLEAMARALFKSWFVDFDPVHAKAEGRPTGLPDQIAALFPDSFEDSEKGEIPVGWTVENLASFAVLNPESWTQRAYPDAVRYVDLSNTKWGRIESIAEFDKQAAPSRAQRILRPGDTLIGTVRPGNGSYTLIDEDGLTGTTRAAT